MNNPYEYMYMARQGDEYAQRALFLACEEELKAYVNMIIFRYPPYAIYRDDLMQEGRIAFWNAVNSFREDRDCGLRTFVHLVVRRHIRGILRSLCMADKAAMHETVEYDPLILESARYYSRIRDRNRMNEPEFVYQMREAHGVLIKAIGRLSTKDRMVMEAWMNDETYAEACTRMGLSYKAYDGRLQRVRKKIRKALIRV